jgi:hypothetical protein
MDTPKVGDRFESDGVTYELLPEFEVVFDAGTLQENRVTGLTTEAEALKVIKRRFAFAYVEPWDLTAIAGEAHIFTPFYRSKADYEKQIAEQSLDASALQQDQLGSRDHRPADFSAGVIEWHCLTSE